MKGCTRQDCYRSAYNGRELNVIIVDANTDSYRTLRAEYVLRRDG